MIKDGLCWHLSKLVLACTDVHLVVLQQARRGGFVQQAQLQLQLRWKPLQSNIIDFTHDNAAGDGYGYRTVCADDDKTIGVWLRNLSGDAVKKVTCDALRNSLQCVLDIMTCGMCHDAQVSLAYA